LLTVVTNKNDIYILEGVIADRKSLYDEEDMQGKIEKFTIRQYIQNCFNDQYINACFIKSYLKGLIVGSEQGHILFIEKLHRNEQLYKSIRIASRDKPAKVVGVSFDKTEDHMVVAYSTNEICTINIHNIFENLRNPVYDIKFDFVCDGFHQGPITAMDVALQRPLIVTMSNVDKTIRVWNYLTGHCEYCKIVLTEKDDNEKEMDILSVAIHPSGYYMAVSDKEMIRFFHLCHKELRLYNNDLISNESSKSNCHLLKFSCGGHLLAAVSNKTLYIIRSYTRETIKTIKTPHTGVIKNIIFDETDNFVYTVGNEGVIVEYSLFDFKFEEISTKFVTYSDATISKFNGSNNIIACGLQTATKNVISEIAIQEGDKTDTAVKQVEKLIYSICHLRSKKCNITSLACGTKDGDINLYSFPFKDKIWDGVRAHRTAVNLIAYSRDTNLLFSAGEDGNLFIYCVYELPDGENILFDDNKIGMNQLSSILDEGLGDNVLVNLQSIFNLTQTIDEQKEQLVDGKNYQMRIIKENELKLKERETELNKKKEIEIKSLNDQIKEIKISKDTTIDHYEEKFAQTLNDHNKILLEREKSYNEKLDQLSGTIHELNSRIHYMQHEQSEELKLRESEYEKRIRDLEAQWTKKYEELKKINDKLGDDMKDNKKNEEVKFIHIDKEHELEINFKTEKYEKLITQLKKDYSELEKKYIDAKEGENQKDSIIQEKETIIKRLNNTKEQLEGKVSKLREINEDRERKVQKLTLEKNDVAKDYEKEKKMETFSSKLKNEMYRKNNELMSNFNKQQNDIGDLRSTSKNLEKELEGAIRQLEQYEKTMQKQHIQIETLKKECDNHYSAAKIKENDFDNLLKHIYEIFQTNDRNKIIKGVKSIYSRYLSEDAIKKIDSSKLNVNIQDELEKQIDFLQRSLLSVNDLTNKKELIQKSEIFRRTEENSLLIEELNKYKRDLSLRDTEYLKLKSDFSALKKTIENYKRMEKDYNRIKSPSVNIKINLEIT
jgi:WD40 repeat protein